jgi:HAD superfamily hydrolase (TIGR01509 family)
MDTNNENKKARDKTAGSAVRAVFFDLDGTLVDSIPALYKNYHEFLSRYGCNGSQEEFKFVNGPALPEIIAHLKQVHKIPGTEEEIMAVYNHGLELNYRDVVGPRDKAGETLAELRRLGYRLSLVTSTHKSLVDHILKRLGWESAFDAIITGETVERAKPAPDIYLAALAEAGAAGATTPAVEDSPNGTRAVASSGCRSISLCVETPEELLRNAGAEFIIRSLDELPALISGIHEGKF